MCSRQIDAQEEQVEVRLQDAINDLHAVEAHYHELSIKFHTLLIWHLIAAEVNERLGHLKAVI